VIWKVASQKKRQYIITGNFQIPFIFHRFKGNTTMMHSFIGRKPLSIIFTILLAVMLVPQFVVAQGESAVPFLLIAPNARADGMGEAGGALADDASAAHWNPAGLAFQTGQEASLTHSNWLPGFGLSDLFYEYLAYKNHIEDWGGTISASVTYLNLGEFVETRDDPTPLGTFKAYEFAITAGYATRMTDALGLGLNLRFIRSALAPIDVQGQGREGVANTVSVDLGALYRFSGFNLFGMTELEPPLSIGLNLSNIGPKLTYIDADQADPLPTNLRLGFAFRPIQSEYNNLTLVLDFSRLLVRRYPVPKDSAGNPLGDPPPPDPVTKAIFSAWGDGGLKKVTIGTGIEYWYGSPKLVAIRWGYFYEHPDYGNRKFMTFGAGIRYDIYGFDFSYLSAIEENHPLAETLRFTLLISWGGEQE